MLSAIARAVKPFSLASVRHARSRAGAVNIIRYSEHELVPWKNGQGVTRIVAVQDAEASRSWLWRLSIATVDRDGPFSDFTGYDRVILLLQGAGMTLDFDGHAPAATLDSPFEPLAFDGGWPCHATLLGGPLTDFNVISAADQVSAKAEVVPVKSASTAQAAVSLHHSSPSTATLFYVLQGACRVSGADSGEPILLEAGDCLHVGSTESWSGRAVVAHDDEREHNVALLYRVELSPRVPHRSAAEV